MDQEEYQTEKHDVHRFTKNGYFNPKNDVVWANSRSDVNERGGIHEKEKYPISVMVAIWNGLTEPCFFRSKRTVKWYNIS